MADALSHWTGPSSTTRTASIVRNAATDFAIAVKPNTTTRYCAPPWLALATATPWRCVQSSCRRRTVTKNKTASPRPPIGGSRKTPGATPRCGRFIWAMTSMPNSRCASGSSMPVLILSSVLKQTITKRCSIILPALAGRTRYRCVFQYK